MIKEKFLILFAIISITGLSLVSDISGEEVKILKAIASSVEHNNAELRAEKSIDGNVSTRWSSQWSDPQWIYYDLGTRKAFNLITIIWETAYGKVYEIQISDDLLNWKTVFEEGNGNGNKDIIITGEQKARYVRMYGISRGTGWGYSIYDFKVLNCVAGLISPPSNLSAVSGDNIIVLDWDDSIEGDLCGYDVYRSPAIDGKYEKINAELIEASRYADKTVINGTVYYYFVQAIDYLNNESKASEKISVTSSPIKQKDSYLDADLPIEERIHNLVSRMTLDEKIEQLSGIPKYDKMTSHSNDRLKIPSLKCADGPHGVRWGQSTAFPVPIAIASSWEPELMEKIGVAIGKEMKARGRNHSLGPCLNIAKDPRGGRTYEGFGEDPYLASRMAVSAVKGIQSQKVIATPKHFACNNIEKNRGSGSVEIDERTLREIYLPAFKACIKEANAWSIMSAYNKVNEVYCSENKHLLRDILKDEWGFKGLVLSDWGACHSTVESINAGLDLEMPEISYYGTALLEAVKEGLVSEETINDSVKRILRAKFWAGLFDTQAGIKPDISEDEGHIELAGQSARKSIVLLKNENNLLPIHKNKIKSIAVLGPNADMTTAGTDLGSSQITSAYSVTPLQGIKNKIGDKIKITNNVQEADVAIIFVGLTRSIAGRVEGEGIDREYLHLPGNQDSLIEEISRINKNTVIVLIGGSAVTMNKWVDNVSAIIETWYSGQEGGNAIADVLFGDYNPGGKLPITFPESIEQLPPFDWDYKSDYERGVGYRYYDKQNIEPLFPFGHGLSYTKFEYSGLKIKSEVSTEGIVNISIGIKNIGDREGDEVVQLYLQDMESSIKRPIKELKRFERITLKPGEIKKLNFELAPEDLAFYNKDMKYVVEPGTFKVMIGSSSRDIRLSGYFEIMKPISVIK